MVETKILLFYNRAHPINQPNDFIGNKSKERIIHAND